MSNILNIKFNDYGFLKDLLIENYNRYINFRKFINNSDISPTVVESNSSLETFSYLDVEKINKINNSIVFIDCTIEGIHSSKLFKQYEKSNFYVIFSNCIWNKEKYDIDIDYINLDYYYYIQNTIQFAASVYNENYYYSREYSFNYPKHNIFVSTIGEIRKERSYLVNSLLDKIDYNNFILKYQGQNLGKNFDHVDFCAVNFNNFDAYKSILNNANISSIIPTELYNQAYFNLVVETNIDYPYSFYSTEKTTKSLITGIPFVIYSTPRFLQNLRSLGFKTYNELWNEDYDLEIDYKKRADKIANLVNQLQHFDWQANREKLQQIANHNAALMLKNNNMFITQFEKIRKTLEIIKDKDAQYLKENPQLFEWLDNNTV